MQYNTVLHSASNDMTLSPLGTISAQTNVLVEYELKETASCTKVMCTFPMDSSTTDCVVVVHQRISQLSSSGLMNITSYKFSRSGNSASGCIPRVDQLQYQIGVVGGKRLIIISPPGIKDYHTFAKKGPWVEHLTLGLDGGMGRYSRHEYRG
jgi:hypothetical protein